MFQKTRTLQDRPFKAKKKIALDHAEIFTKAQKYPQKSLFLRSKSINKHRDTEAPLNGKTLLKKTKEKGSVPLSDEEMSS